MIWSILIWIMTAMPDSSGQLFANSPFVRDSLSRSDRNGVHFICLVMNRCSARHDGLKYA